MALSKLYRKLTNVQTSILHAMLILNRYGVSSFWNMYNPFSSQKLVKVVLEDGRPCWIRRGTSDFHAFVQIAIYNEMNLPIKLAKPRVIDAGANIGLATRFLKMKYPDAEILAIEPDSDNFELLQRNTEGLTGVSCVRAGLWWRAQKLCIANASDEAWAYRTEEAQAEASITIDAFTLDQLMEKNGWSFVELVKLDIESAELQVLKNSADWISKVGAILIETHDNLKPGCRLAAYMATRDFPYEMQLGEKILFSQWEWEGASARA